jgi:S-adenosylmethionine/arginine decarboxylase-like enzyme
MSIFKERAVAELYGVPKSIIEDPERLFEVSELIAQDLNLTVVDRIIDHRFIPTGSSGGVTFQGELKTIDGLVLAESHYFWHTWPEEEFRRHLSIDIYTCSPRIQLQKAELIIATHYHPAEMGFAMVPTPRAIPTDQRFTSQNNGVRQLTLGSTPS